MKKQKVQSTQTRNSTTPIEPTDEKEKPDAFRFANAIMTTKVYNDPDDIDANYNAFFNNKILSQHADAILHVNVLNMYYQQLTARQNYNYLFHAIRAMKRKFGKWGKRVEDDRIELIQTYYGFSEAKARYAATLLTEDQIKVIKKELDTGG